MNISTNISPALFWDVDVSKLDWQQHRQLITERVIQRGSLKEIQEVTEHYGIKEFRNIICQIPYLEKRDMAFVNIYFNIPLNELKCYTKKQLAQSFLD